MRLDDIVLRPQQQSFVTRFTEEPGRHLLLAPAGAGKMTAVLVGLRELARTKPAAALIVTPPTVGENLLARLRTYGLPTQRITKRWLRAAADKAPEARWPSSIFATVSPHLLHDPWVAREMARIRWDAIVVDNADAELTEPNFHRWLRAVPANRVALLANRQSPSLAELADSVTQWEPDWVAASRQRIGAHVVRFEREAAEVNLLRKVASLVDAGSGHLDWSLEEVKQAARSSPFALQAAALQFLEQLRPLRNTLAHGRTGDPVKTADRTDELQSVIRLYAELEAIVDAVDTLEFDARFQALYELVLELRASTPEPVVIFVSELRTAAYVVDRLRFLQVPAAALEPGLAPDEVHEAAAYVVPDEALEGLALSGVRRAIFYDVSRDRASQSARWATVRSDNMPTEAWVLTDTSPAADDERELLRAPEWVDWPDQSAEHKGL